MKLDLATIEAAALEHSVPALDALMIALNYHGMQPYGEHPRSRMRIRPLDNDETWQIILPLDNDRSPFTMTEGGFELDGAPVAALVGSENDDVVLSYIRAGGRSLTLNTNARSRCTGCLFCPNVIEDAADSTLDTESELEQLLRWIAADEGWGDLSEVDVITVCSGCFYNPESAIEHLGQLRVAAERLGFDGRLHLLSSVIRSDEDLRQLADVAGACHLTLTLECFTRRELILKDTKASLTLDDARRIMDTCRELDILADYTYVAGLDGLDASIEGIVALAPHCTTFPRIQVYQAHNDYMRRAQNKDASELEYFLKIRNAVEEVYANLDLAPISWENYRPLWYSEFNGRPVKGPRV